MDFTQKYRPKNKDEFVGNPEILTEVTESVSEGIHVLVTGESGWGKTSMAHVVANELGLTLVENNPSDLRSPENLKILLEKMKTRSLFGKILYLFESVDTIRGTDGPATQDILQRMSKESIHPIFFTASDAYQVPYKIKKFCKPYQMKPPTLRSIADRIKEIAKHENIPTNKINFKRVTPDIRSSIIASFDNSTKMRTTDNNFRLAEKAFIDQKIVDLHPAWLMDNVHNFYHGMDVYNALKIIKYAIELDDNYFYSCLPKARRGKAGYPYYLRKK